MQIPTHGPVWRAVRRMLVPLCYPEYRRMVTRFYLLSMRLELLCALFALVSPFATPGLLHLLRRRFENLRADVAEFGRLVRSRPTAMARSIAAGAGAGAHGGSRSAGGEFQNPWL